MTNEIHFSFFSNLPYWRSSLTFSLLEGYTSSSLHLCFFSIGIVSLFHMDLLSVVSLHFEWLTFLSVLKRRMRNFSLNLHHKYKAMMNKTKSYIFTCPPKNSLHVKFLLMTHQSVFSFVPSYQYEKQNQMGKIVLVFSFVNNILHQNTT